jgi:FMN phosphatase YigB (HAD superfamily)
MFNGITTLLLDMNSTFMFGEDRFEDKTDYSEYYNKTGGGLPSDAVNRIIRDVLSYLGGLYTCEKYQNSFPTVEQAIIKISDLSISAEEIDNLIKTFSYFEHGYIPVEYVLALKKLKIKYKLALVADIWAPKDMWLETFNCLGIDQLFSAMYFSSDHGIVKPSPKPFEMIVSQLNVPKRECVVIGDSVRRDLDGAVAADISCILVNGASHREAIGSFKNLVKISEIA